VLDMAIKRWLYLIITLCMSIHVLAQAPNCPSGFATSGACGIAASGSGGQAWQLTGPAPALSGTSAILVQANAGHNGWGMIYQTAENVQAFTWTTTFVGNGNNFVLVLQNANNNGSPTGFSSGAGGEAGFSQMAGGSNIAPNFVFAVEIDQYSPLTQSGSFTYSSAQWYQTLETPAIPTNYNSGYLSLFPITKLSTSPVPLNNPPGTQGPGSATTDVFSATLIYDGYNLTLNLYDVTAGGTCTPTTSGTCFSQTWTGVYIPEIVGSNTAYVTYTAGTSESNTPVLLVKSSVFTSQTPTGTPSFTAWNANSTYNIGTTSAASPVYSVAPGTYSTAQTVSLSVSTSPHNYICYVLQSGTGAPAFYPMVDMNGGCTKGTVYSSSITISSTSTLYAIAGSDNAAFGSQSSPAGLGPPSTIVKGVYTISSQATAPSCTPGSGSGTSVLVTCTNSNSGTTIMCYTEDGTNPVTNLAGTNCSNGTPLTGSSNTINITSTVTTLNVVAGTSTDSDSSISSYGPYTINPAAATPTFSPIAGTYTSVQSVTISTTSSGAIICYRTDGGTPATNGTTGCQAGSTLYSSPVTVAMSLTLKAIAGGTGYTDGSVGSAAYTINLPIVGSGVATKSVFTPGSVIK
jgi:Chitobiase/beta-hexosaminidase C-terminal domain